MYSKIHLFRSSLFFFLFIISVGVSADALKNGMMAFQSGDYEQAMKVWQPLAEDGNMIAQFSLGMMYHDGYGVEKNEIEAANWFLKSAEQGFAPAQFNLGNAYKFGRGVQQNTALAIQWWHKSADQDSASAQFNLAIAYYYGDGVDKNETEGMKWFRKAAENNHPEAIKRLDGELKEANKNMPLNTAVSDKPPAMTDEPVSRITLTDNVEVKTPSEESTDESGQMEITRFKDLATPIVSLPPIENETPVEAPDEIILKKTPAVSLITPEIKKPVRVNIKSEKEIMPEAWVLSQTPTQFTIQLISGTSKKAVEDYAHKNGLTGTHAICSYVVNEKRWYALVYNVFDSGTAARKALAELPTGIKKRSPWVRKFQELQSTITRSLPGLEAGTN
ncbi:MAG: SPOR domain-containing protein [Gammaproteobacteria bacterium]|nr:SPOR domain-containing protein [Gammaproteobacteria bacterium]